MTLPPPGYIRTMLTYVTGWGGGFCNWGWVLEILGRGIKGDGGGKKRMGEGDAVGMKGEGGRQQGEWVQVLSRQYYSD